MAYRQPWKYNKTASSSTPTDPNAPKKRGNPNWKPYKKGPTVIPGSMYKKLSNPSDEQRDIINAVVDGNESLLVSAYAGVGKTSVCTEAMHQMAAKSPRTTQAYIIFAKRNQSEATGKCPAIATVKTAHGFGLQSLGKAYGKITVDKEKTDRIAMALVGPEEKDAELRYMVAKGIDLGKDYLATTPEKIIEIVEKHGIEICDLSESEFADKILKGMEVSAQQPNVVSFSDMVWLNIRLGITVPTFDLLFLDELQDLNAARQELAFRAIGKNGRFVGVGDDNQSIFQFSGADRHAMNNMRERTKAKIMPLHKTFRCGRKIVEFARTYVADYIAADTNPEGEVVECSMQDMMSDTSGVMPGDFVLSRTNAPCVKIAMSLLKQGRKCVIQGKDLGNNLVFMIKRSKAVSVAGFQTWLDEWANAEIERLTAKNKDYEHITDKREVMEVFCNGETDLSVVKGKINAMFDEAEPNETHRVRISSIHKSKGDEANRVWRLESSFTCRPKTEEDQVAERNINYVSITRAINSLYLVS